MTSKELKKQAQEIREVAKKVTVSKESARKFLISTNAYTNTGQLKKSFR